LILSDEGVHGHYIGYKFQLAFRELTPERQEEIRDKAYSLLMELYENEIEYTRSIYDDLGMTEDVINYLHYNANKALMNMGFDPMFPPEICKVNPAVMASLVPAGDETHDFFSGGGSAYAMLRVEPTTDADWAGWRGN
jgi:ribonucleoside-diphosphate reductase beta chain